MSIETKLIDACPYVTVRIENFKSDGSVSVGTGFFVERRVNPENVSSFIVTNKHVIKGGAIGKMVFHSKDNENDKSPSGRLIQVCLENFSEAWIEHPNPEVDIAILPFQPINDVSKTNRTSIFRSGIDESFFYNNARSLDLSPIEDLLMIGYPGGHWDYVNNLPVYRRGVTASHPKFDFQGRSEFLIDLACFPGSSGSPVFLFNPNGFRQGEDLVLGERFAFMGLLYAGPTHTIKGSLTVDSEDGSIEIPITANAMMHLGYVIKAREVSTAIDAFEHALKIRGDGKWDFGKITVESF